MFGTDTDNLEALRGVSSGATMVILGGPGTSCAIGEVYCISSVPGPPASLIGSGSPTSRTHLAELRF